MSNALESFLGRSIELWKASVANTHKKAVIEEKELNNPNASGEYILVTIGVNKSPKI